MDHKQGPTLKDLAEASGLSIATVSKVLNNRDGASPANREKVLKLAADMGYQARGSKAAVPERLTLVMLDRFVTNNTFYNEIVDGVLAEAGNELIATDVRVLASATLCASDIEQLLAESPGPLVLIGIDRRDITEAVHRSATPAVIINGMDRDMNISSVSPDYHFGGWAATSALLDLGHRDIVHVTHPYRESIKRRLDGFRDALEEAGIAFDPDRHLLDLGDPNLVSIEARASIERFLDKRGSVPTAFFCVADIVALAAIQALKGRGLSVPEDVSVIGFDDLSIGAHSNPPLTTVRIDRQQLGRKAVRLLLERWSQADTSVERINMGVRLITRQSSGPVRTS
ncbi:LacI family DNA-binding transcriptional regulator [Roseibium suaedae]|uniref:Transcriptional regulator, LacI family n=1 Tax=Roseibium suaedae TaxID=735517 RepID=A0A1M7L8U3_9HYPH|nr:LacI family DNA-binding transcriptional regulator [Roseibium suaedae]SHM74184.1 transcriptional regulator, LacI family [Roseibium suaedae]